MNNEVILKHVARVISEWHEAGRKEWDSPTIDYDSYKKKSVVVRRRWICLDEGQSGAFLVDQTDGCVYRIKSAYGVPNFAKLVGKIDEVKGEDLLQMRWW